MEDSRSLHRRSVRGDRAGNDALGYVQVSAVQIRELGQGDLSQLLAARSADYAWLLAALRRHPDRRRGPRLRCQSK